MLRFVLCMALLGGALGLRYRVTALIPLIGGAWLLAGIGGAALFAPGSSLAFVFVAAAAAAELGYVAGLIVRRAVLEARLPPPASIRAVKRPG